MFAGQRAPSRVVKLPCPFESAEQIVDALFAAVTPRTKLLVASHITSPTAVIFPVERLCARARREGIATCIDGPHAPAQVPVDIDRLGCDFYCASLHKWLSAPFGSGFLYAAPKHQATMEPPIRSLGPAVPGTDLRLGGRVSLERQATIRVHTWPCRRRSTSSSRSLRRDVPIGDPRARPIRLPSASSSSTGLTPIIPDSPEWYGTMAHVPLPPGDARELQTRLWTEHRIEVPIVAWNELSIHPRLKVISTTTAGPDRATGSSTLSGPC